MKRYVSATSTSNKYDIYTDVDTIRAIAQDYGDDGDEWIDESKELLADNGLEFYGIGVAKDKYYEKLSFDGEELITVGINPDGSLVYGIFVGDRFCPVTATSNVAKHSEVMQSTVVASSDIADIIHDDTAAATYINILETYPEYQEEEGLAANVPFRDGYANFWQDSKGKWRLGIEDETNYDENTYRYGGKFWCTDELMPGDMNDIILTPENLYEELKKLPGVKLNKLYGLRSVIDDFYGDLYKYTYSSDKVNASSDATYQNRRNPNKFIETRKYDDGHTVARQYMKWDTPNGEVKNYNGAKDAKRGRYSRVNKSTLDSMLEDYDQVFEGWSNWERIPGSTAFRLNYTIDGELIGYVDEGRECYIAYDAHDRQLGAFENISEAQIAVENLM